jgi:NADH dehydrogenase/NADH:ubiquinone oxidoreductase subunit G
LSRKLKAKRCKTFDIKAKNKKVTIDGQAIEVEPGTTILQARMIGGESVPPAMCYYSKLEGSGGKCRCCLVEVAKGSDADSRPMPKLMASCNRMHGRNGGQQQIFG